MRPRCRQHNVSWLNDQNHIPPILFYHQTSGLVTVATPGSNQRFNISRCHNTCVCTMWNIQCNILPLWPCHLCANQETNLALFVNPFLFCFVAFLFLWMGNPSSWESSWILEITLAFPIQKKVSPLHNSDNTSKFFYTDYFFSFGGAGSFLVPCP